ncbi:auxin-responsive protein IAA28 isoform X2 [Nicotiana tabacum]|uniref:Auxin-responsive protein n=2 Tax=Nicotiana TaxID=4085 RepID=A0A1S3ZHK5_TOBAC|nr:PREDICTED: auxin-responsive protein IAA28-like isoform X2 [Nicotiana sylvestris]XP_016463801.1 PREDICTED: auxin-responsive protein IAA28-like isoform X2 [Nicotiana tabacum]
MELELALALPSYFPLKSSDLNGNVDSFDDNFSEMKNDMISYINHKSNFSAANSDYDDSDKFERKTLPLLVWNGQPNDEQVGDHRKRTTFQACYTEFKEENGVVGWPPIKSWRKKQIHGINNDVIGRRNSMYVKVKMEGVAIGRKINLRLYDSYQVLTNSLIQMFAKYQSCDENGTRFTLLYQDREGDWMLAGDVPWQTFMETVQRIQILRNGKRGRINSRKSSDIS